MASKRSIAGYLVLKPAGALSRLKGRKRMWFVFDESKCRLLYYKNEVDAQSKEPLGVIEIRGSAISLALEEENQFVIHSNEREHALVAEDHETMMLWILAMQQATSSVQSKVLQRTHSLQLGNDIKHETLKRMHSLWATTSQDLDLMTNGKPTLSKRPPPVHDSRSLSPTAGAITESTDTNNNDHSQGRAGIIKEPSTDRSSDTESCDDSDTSDAPDSGSDRIRLLRKMNSEGTSLQDITPSKDRASSLSGTSVSSDSAVGTSDCSISVRLQELESELMCTKCDLAKALNRETAYKSIIEDKILLVNELEEKLRTAEDPDDTIIW